MCQSPELEADSSLCSGSQHGCHTELSCRESCTCWINLECTEEEAARLQAETMVIINLYALHYDPAHWPEPEKFRPERFLEASGKLAPKPQSWLPFSAGHRNCLGEGVARPELHLLFAGLLHKFTFSLPEGEPDRCTASDSTLLRNPVNLRLVATPRN